MSLPIDPLLVPCFALPRMVELVFLSSTERSVLDGQPSGDTPDPPRVFLLKRTVVLVPAWDVGREVERRHPAVAPHPLDHTDGEQLGDECAGDGRHRADGNAARQGEGRVTIWCEVVNHCVSDLRQPEAAGMLGPNLCGVLE